MKDIVDCLEYIQDNQRRQEDRMNIINDKLNYIMAQQEHIKNEAKKKLNEIYGAKSNKYMSIDDIMFYIPITSIFALSINGVVVKRDCTYTQVRDMLSEYKLFKGMTYFQLDKITKVIKNSDGNMVNIITESEETTNDR